jgi:hypothetical protein
MKWINPSSDTMRVLLSFITSNISIEFYISNFQIVGFDNLADAVSFVNSREFAVKQG